MKNAFVLWMVVLLSAAISYCGIKENDNEIDSKNDAVDEDSPEELEKYNKCKSYSLEKCEENTKYCLIYTGNMYDLKNKCVVRNKPIECRSKKHLVCANHSVPLRDDDYNCWIFNTCAMPITTDWDKNYLPGDTYADVEKNLSDVPKYALEYPCGWGSSNGDPSYYGWTETFPECE